MARTAVVLGGYGLIGAAIARALLAEGYDVRCIGRDPDLGRRTVPQATWLDLDLAEDRDLSDALAGADLVVNAAGALQDGTRDDLRAIHVDAVRRIVAALDGGSTRLIQISAVGAAPDAETEFLSSKAEGDAIIAASDLSWTILRPALVLAPEAHGGSALLRAAAAMPVLGLIPFPSTPVQTLHIDDLCGAVLAVARGTVGDRLIAELGEAEPQPMSDVIARLRGRLGYPAWRMTLRLPPPLLRLGGRIADGLGHLGWRSPMRSTALTILQSGITADTGPWREAGGPPFRPLAETLATLPPNRQERWFARLYLLLPIIIATLCLFWLLSGLIGLLRFSEAVAILTDRGRNAATAGTAVLAGALVDIGLGLAVLWRRWCRAACMGMIAVSLAYLLGGTLLAPDLWTDPLGPLVKVLPAIMLALVPLALAEAR